VALATAAQGWMIIYWCSCSVGDRDGLCWLHIGKGWVPADDGILGQSALRVMQGQLPHRILPRSTRRPERDSCCCISRFRVSLMSLRLCAFLFFWLGYPPSTTLRCASPRRYRRLITLVAVA